MQEKILLFKLGALGDVLMTTPFIRQLRKNKPDSKIDYLIGRSFVSVLEGNKNLDEIIPFDDAIFFKKKIISLIKLIRQIKKRKYDMIFIFDRHWIFSFVGKRFGIRKRNGFYRDEKSKKYLTEYVKFKEVRHEIYYYLDLLKKIYIKPDYSDNKIDLFIEKKEIDFVKNEFKKYNLKNVIAVAPGGGINPGQRLKEKIWDINNFIELINKLISKGNDIILIGGKTDIEKGKIISEKINYQNNNINKIHIKKLYNFMGVSIKQSASLISLSDYLICNDSGPMHIGASVNKKIISIFGPTDPRRVAPLWLESKYIWKEKEPSYNIYGKLINGKDSINKVKPNDVIKLIT